MKNIFALIVFYLVHLFILQNNATPIEPDGESIDYADNVISDRDGDDGIFIAVNQTIDFKPEMIQNSIRAKKSFTDEHVDRQPEREIIDNKQRSSHNEIDQINMEICDELPLYETPTLDEFGYDCEEDTYFLDQYPVDYHVEYVSDDNLC